MKAKNNHIYFDYAATTPVDPEVIKAMEPYLYESFGNASSPHSLGREANKALEDARTILANFIGAKTDEIVFNSGATEGNNHVIQGLAEMADTPAHIIISSLEHHSVHEPAAHLTQYGFDVSYIDVDENGVVDLQAVETAITEKTILIAIMHASNEIGTVQPVAEIGEVARANNIPFLVDACQTVGHLPVNVDELNADYITLSAHKFYGPKGVGALYIRSGQKLPPVLLGGDQERSRRASTQNVSGVVGLGKAIELCEAKMLDEIKSQTQLRDKLLTEVPKLIDNVKVNGHLTQRLPNNAHFSFAGIESELLLVSLDMNGIAASMGSACTSGTMEISHVLKAIGLDEKQAGGSLRITIGRFTTDEQVDYLLEKLPTVVKKLRK